MQTKYLKINAEDNVAVATVTLNAGESISVNSQEITLKSEIPAGHKFALKDFAANDFIVKYGYAIGHAREAIAEGGLVNEKNIKTNLDGLLEYTYSPALEYLEIPNRHLTFNGYRRKSGEVGVRNEIWVIPTVGCVNGTVNQLVDALKRETNGAGVDAIVG
ncbi:MAG TPA: UxaA family hydrolase, partial [Paludibacter sp.]|nr:UxaA family hydrolase [Paludibacter sp.]